MIKIFTGGFPFFIFFQTAAQDGVKLWDLRKLRNFRSFTPYDEDTATQSGINTKCILLEFDMKNILEELC